MPINTRLRLAVAAATVATALIAPNAANAVVCTHADDNPNDISLTQAKRATLCLLNKQRRAHGIRKLKENRRLDRASQRHATDMSQHNYFAHGNFVRRIQAARYLRGARGYTLGENIAWGSWNLATPRRIVKGWMNSSGHRHNILNGRFHEIGLGIARGAPVGGQDRAGTYVTDFGTRF